MIYQYKKANPRLLIYGALVFGGLLGLIFVGTNLATSQNVLYQIRLATTVKRESFTELYFENHMSLPRLLIPQKEYLISFSIHNVENRDMNYPYEVYLDTGSTRYVIDRRTVLVKKDAVQRIEEKFQVPHHILGRDMVVVNLITKKQHIDFWVEG